MIEEFSKRKKDVLSKIDKSNKTTWDEKITVLCNKINLSDKYYTTSSCSGRAVLMINQDKKEENLFVVVHHEKISLEELKDDLKTALKRDKKIKFKLEPCILHIACRTLEDSWKLYNKAKLAGWKKSGIVGMKNGFTLELNSTERLEFPIIDKKKILVNDEFLKIVVEDVNKKLKKSWEKIERLEKLLIN